MKMHFFSSRNITLTLLMGISSSIVCMDSIAQQEITETFKRSPELVLLTELCKYHGRAINLDQLEICIKNAREQGVNLTEYLADDLFRMPHFILPKPELVALLIKYGARISGTRIKDRETISYSLLERSRARKEELNALITKLTHAIQSLSTHPAYTSGYKSHVLKESRIHLTVIQAEHNRAEEIIKIFEKYLSNQKHALMIRANDFLRQHAASPYNT